MTARLIMKLKVVSAEYCAKGVTLYTLAHPWREHLPPPTPGAHVDVRLPDGRTRQYSLCGDPDDDAVYRIAVKREDEGRGASRWIHSNLASAPFAHVSMPRNNFPLVAEAERFILIAGGIGITPFVPMVHRLVRDGRAFHLHFCARSTGEAPLLAMLRDISGERLTTYFSKPVGERFDARAVLAAPQPGTHVYCCGPTRLTNAVRFSSADWPQGHVHFEVFQATLDENFRPEPFDVRIASSGEIVRVPAERTALEVLRERGYPLPSSCEMGICGSCECGYREGTVIHRDSVLSIGARQDRMMLCVSRARVAVTLDL